MGPILLHTEVNKHVEIARDDSSGTQKEVGTYELRWMVQGRLTRPPDTEGVLHLVRGSGQGPQSLGPRKRVGK